VPYSPFSSSLPNDKFLPSIPLFLVPYSFLLFLSSCCQILSFHSYLPEVIFLMFFSSQYLISYWYSFLASLAPKRAIPSSFQTDTCVPFPKLNSLMHYLNHYVMTLSEQWI
jgi:hypothetical protein